MEAIDMKSVDVVAQRNILKLRRDLGRTVLDALEDPQTVEVMRNADGRLWIEKLGQGMKVIGTMSDLRAISVITTVAGMHGKEIKYTQPIIECELPTDGSRFAGQIPPIVQSPTFAIRKKAVAVFSLNDYLKHKVLTEQQYKILCKAITSRKNIVVVGGTGSGKTTFVNAIVAKIVESNPSERIFIIEDTGEIQCDAVNHVQYHTSMAVSMSDLLKASLRMRPDRILVGEVRGAEALDLLDAWNTGHPGGVATVHANSAIEALTRIVSLVSRNASAPKDIGRMIAEAVNLIVHIERTPTGRVVKEILSVEGFSDNRFITEECCHEL